MVMIQRLFFYTLILAAVGGVIALIWWLFKTQRLDMVHIHHQRILKACKSARPPYQQQLWFRSTSEEWASRYVGDIIGMSMIQSIPQRKVSKEGLETRKSLAEEGQKYERVIFVAFRPPGFFNRVFGWLLGSDQIVMGSPEDFTPLGASIVYMKGLTFAPPLYEILTLAHHWERRHFIDETIKENIYRYTLQENLKELATMIDDAIDASPSHRKKQETQVIQQVPIPGMQQYGNR